MLTWETWELARFGFSREDFDRVRRRLMTELAHPPSKPDVLWALWNEALDVHTELSTLQDIYHAMARFRSHQGRDPTLMLRQCRMMELGVLLERGEEVKERELMARVETREDSCASCSEFDGTVVAISEALASMPLPNPACTFHLHEGSPSFCRCHYEAHMV